MQARGLTILAVAIMGWASSATAQIGAQVVSTALTNCLSGDWPSSAVSRLDKLPPGLIAGLRNLSAVRLPGSKGLAFTYVGDVGSAGVCGIALYGAVDPVVRQQIRKAIDAHSDLRPAEERFWKVAAPRAEKLYWGDPRAPGLRGVLELDRPPSQYAPTLDVHYHVVHVR